MENKEKLTKAFTESLGIEPQLVTDELTYNTIPQWDSTAHMVLIAELEIILQKYDDNIEFA